MIARCSKNIKDIYFIINNLRKEDKEELRAIFKRNWKKKVLKIIKKTTTYTVIGKDENNTPIAMGGYSIYSQNKNIAGIWFLVTEEVKKHKLTMLLMLKRELNYYDMQFGLTYNILYKSNIASKKWLKWLGFKFDNILNPVCVPKDFELFYRLKNINGLGA